MGFSGAQEDYVRRIRVMRIYRITPKKYLENYQGRGASFQDGARWNRRWQPVMYFALSPATALLEMANYLTSPRLVPPSFRLGIYEIPDAFAVHRLPDASLPRDWAAFPYPVSTQTLGGDWIDKGKTAGLIVPSAAVPQGLEKIMVINPIHKDCRKIKLADATSELYNKRSFSGI